MTHLDEGTIHAWLDGALDAERARAVEDHARRCARCGATVAEARGLIAASSRILGALDDVPANVIPNAAPARRRRPMWRAAPWVTGIAAVLVAAVVLRTSDEALERQPVTQTRPEAPAETRPSLNATSFADSAVEAQRDVAARAGSPDRAQRRVDDAARGADARRMAADAQRAPALEQVVVTAAPAAPAAPAPSAAPSRREPAPGTVGSIAAVGATSAMKSASAPAEPPPSSAIVPQRSAVLDMSTLRPIDPLRDSVPDWVGLAGCYAINLSERREAGFAANAVAAAADARARARAPEGRPAAAPPVAEFQRTVRPVLLVRLDTLAGRPGYIVRDARSDSSVGWWRRAGVDSAVVDLLAAGVRAIAGSAKVGCPDR